ncbi:MAG: hypothetical protein QOF91_132 [Alphaproteobacteria bacterium]|jgi:hypothetical protein|nr:hypothetical protein [Alphaproteobacteria bacterium]
MPWQTVPRANFMFLHAARLQAHHAAQWLARAARAYVPAQPQDRRTNLGWDEAFGGLVTHPLPDGSRLGLRVADLTLSFLDQHPQALPLDGRTESEVRTWLGGHVAARNLAAGKLDDPSPYTIPDHVLARGARYSLDDLGDALKTLAAWYANANAALAGVQQHLVARKLHAPPVRCWPHRFDLDCAVALPHGRTMGIGYSPGDEFCDEPYFYTSMWPEPPIPALPLLPAMAHWHTYKFLAALAPAHKIVAAHDQGAYVGQFLDVSVAAALHALR